MKLNAPTGYHWTDADVLAEKHEAWHNGWMVGLITGMVITLVGVLVGVA